MKLLTRWIVAVVLNTLLLLVAQEIIPGFSLSGSWVNWLVLGVILTVLNFVLKPVLRFFLAPVIILTLGLGLLLINMLLLYLLDILSGNLTIQGIAALFWAAVLFGIFNLIFHFATRDQQ